MKKTTTVLLTFLALSTILVTCMSTNPVNAQDMMWGFPTEPNYSKPSIVIHSPVRNETINDSSDLNLSLTIIKPDDFRGSVVSAYYTLTNRISRQVVYINLNDNQTRHGTIQVLNYSSQLGPLEPGEYTLKVNLKIENYYIEYISGEWNFAQKSVMVNAESNPITFTIAPTPTPTPTETPTSQIQNQPVAVPIEYVLLICLAAVAVVAPILLYKRHRKTVNINQ